VDTLDEEDADTLAWEFDVTGGEIENIARKATMQFVLTGLEVDMDMLRKFAKQEKLESNRRKIVGFQ
jgi:hypothetical protein